MKHFTPLIAGLIAALVFSLSATTPGLAATPRQIALGISEPNSQDMSTVDGVTAELGRQPAIWSLWSDWGNPQSGPFPKDAVDGLSQRGIVPMVYWEPVDPSYNGYDCAHWSLSKIKTHYQYIRAWAQAAKDDGHPIILRFAEEMNIPWYVWGTGICTNTPKMFRTAWQYVWNIFRGKGGVGATNVKFLFSVSGGRNVAADYPGNKYVDYMGLTAIDWGISGHTRWRTLQTVMAPTMKLLTSINRTKPIIGAEIMAGYNQNCAKCDKAAFFTQGYPAVVARWPQLVAMVYFDYDMTAQGQADWRLQSPQSALDAYKGLLTQSQFQGTFTP